MGLLSSFLMDSHIISDWEVLENETQRHTNSSQKWRMQRQPTDLIPHAACGGAHGICHPVEQPHKTLSAVPPRHAALGTAAIPMPMWCPARQSTTCNCCRACMPIKAAHPV